MHTFIYFAQFQVFADICWDLNTLRMHGTYGDLLDLQLNTAWRAMLLQLLLSEKG